MVDDRIERLGDKRSDLANLYVVSYQILGSLSREAVLTAIADIIVTLIGSEEFAIFELREGSAPPLLLASSGVEPLHHATLGTPSRIRQKAIERGTVAVRRRDREGDARDPLEACIPLKVGDRVAGIIMIYRLLSHKAALEPLDLEIFGLIGLCGGAALFSRRLQEDSGPPSEVGR